MTTQVKPAHHSDTRPPRAPIFVDYTSAETHAIRSAQRPSTSSMAHPVEFVSGAYEPQGGGQCFAVEAMPGPLGEYTVSELAPAEVTRRQQAGIRAAIISSNETAHAYDLAATLARKGGSVEALHRRYANEARNLARELALRLYVSGVRPAEPIHSSERDNWEARSL